MANPIRARGWAHKALALLGLCALALGTMTPQAQAQGLIRDSEIEATLRSYTDPILRAADLDPSRVEVLIVNDPSLNAFVTNGEKIFLHTGLIMAAESPGELIGVIAHETGHISGGHVARNAEAMRQAMRPALISIGLGVLAIAAGAPDAGAALIMGSPQFAQANFVRHTQVQESSADQAAVTFMDKAGMSSTGLVSFFNREFRQYEFQQRRVPAYAMTHPFTSDRVQALRERVDASPNVNRPDPDGFAESFALMQAKLHGYLYPPAQTLRRYPWTDQSVAARYARAVSILSQADRSEITRLDPRAGAVQEPVTLERALAEISSLLAEQPNNPFFHELMADILFDKNRPQEALPHRRAAVAARPNDSLFLVALARTLTAVGGTANTQEALTVLQEAVRLEPDNAFAWREISIAQDAAGQAGLARLASAEQWYAVGDMQQAQGFAERARRDLPEGSISWRRASDIAAIAAEALRPERERQRDEARERREREERGRSSDLSHDHDHGPSSATPLTRAQALPLTSR